MNSYYFGKINLPFVRKSQIIGYLMKFIIVQPTDVVRGKEFDEKFLNELDGPKWLINLRRTDPWLSEHVARLFWVCCELGFLKYQYPYPHIGQTYRSTRIGRWAAQLPGWGIVAYLGAAYVIGVVAGPVQRFKKVRNIAASVAAVAAWWFNHGMSTFLIAVFAAIAGVVSSWVAGLLTNEDGNPR